MEQKETWKCGSNEPLPCGSPRGLSELKLSASHRAFLAATPTFERLRLCGPEANGAQLPLGSPRRQTRCPCLTIVGLNPRDLAPTRVKVPRLIADAVALMVPCLANRRPKPLFPLINSG